MLRSDNDMTQGQRHTIKVERTPEGTFRASVANSNVSLPPVEDKSSQVAVRILSDRLNEAHMKGEIL
jgi:hypothetical protein